MDTNFKKVKDQHYVPKVYLKAWETNVVTKREPNRPFQGIFYYEKSNLRQGEGRNKNLYYVKNIHIQWIMSNY